MADAKFHKPAVYVGKDVLYLRRASAISRENAPLPAKIIEAGNDSCSAVTLVYWVPPLKESFGASATVPQAASGVHHLDDPKLQDSLGLRMAGAWVEVPKEWTKGEAAAATAGVKEDMNLLLEAFKELSAKVAALESKPKK